MPTDLDEIVGDGIRWLEIGRAARHSRTKIVDIRLAIEAGTIAMLDRDGRTWIPLSVANRLKRETQTMLSLKRRNRIGDTLPPAGSRPGPQAARETQEVLPMSSGRGGYGWQGGKP